MQKSSNEVITINPHDAGLGDPLTLAVVEANAIRAVEHHYRSAGYAVQSVERNKGGHLI